MGLEPWIEKLIQETVDGKKHKRRIQYGIDKIPNPGKKLYKYYSFESQYTLSNLEDGIIYLQNPNEFNDPFDCNIGISINQLANALMPDLMNSAIQNSSPIVSDVLKTCLFNSYEKDVSYNEKQKILSICLQNPKIFEMIEKSKTGDGVSDEEILAMFLETPETMVDLIKTYLYVTNNGNKLSYDSEDFDNIIKSPQILRNLMKNINLPVDEKEKRLLEILFSEEDFLAKIVSMGDFCGIDIQREKVNEFYCALNDGISQVRRELGKSIGIECFAQNPTDILMWSHYANKHTGICVEYDFSKLFSTLSDAFIFPVYYTNQRPLIDIEKMYDISTKSINTSNYSEWMPDIIKSFIVKSEEWKKEKEWRIISLKIKDDDNRKVKLPILSKIITGINISYENYEIVDNLAKAKGVPIHRTRLKNDKYEIEVLD